MVSIVVLSTLFDNCRGEFVLVEQWLNIQETGKKTHLSLLKSNPLPYLHPSSEVRMSFHYRKINFRNIYEQLPIYGWGVKEKSDK